MHVRMYVGMHARMYVCMFMHVNVHQNMQVRVTEATAMQNSSMYVHMYVVRVRSRTAALLENPDRRDGHPELIRQCRPGGAVC